MSDIRHYLPQSPSKRNGLDVADTDSLGCSFCRFKDYDEQHLQHHMETAHSGQSEAPERSKNNQSNLSDAELAQRLAFEEAGIPEDLLTEATTPRQPLSSKSSDASEEDLWFMCFCGESVLFEQADEHADMHQNEAEDGDDAHNNGGVEGYAQKGAVNPDYGTLTNIRNIAPSPQALQSHARRLGKSELGPFAYEKRMPDWLHKMLTNNVGVKVEEVELRNRIFRYSALSNETSLLIPKIQMLSRTDPTVLTSVFCSPVVNHVSKLFKEGGFCGYRNIQMLVSYLRGCSDQNIAKIFKGRLPTVFELQEDIETAWDVGFHTIGRVETGGIKNTRKYIGTSEALALFSLKNVPCRSEGFTAMKDLAACDAMLASLKSYFTQARGSRPPAPVYLQYKGHSMTVVGFEEVAGKNQPMETRETNLIVFDPMFRIPNTLKKLSVNATKLETKLHFLKAFRYPRQRFKRYKEFELLFLES